MPLFNIQTGRLSHHGLWTPGFYNQAFAAADLEAAKAEADRRLKTGEIKATAGDEEIRVVGRNVLARRYIAGGIW